MTARALLGVCGHPESVSKFIARESIVDASPSYLYLLLHLPLPRGPIIAGARRVALSPAQSTYGMTVVAK